MTTSTFPDSFEDSWNDSVLSLVDHGKHVVAMNVLKFKEPEEIDYIFSTYQACLEKALPVIQGRGFTLVDEADDTITSTIAETKAGVDEILNYAVSPWELRATLRLKLAYPPYVDSADLESVDRYIQMCLFMEVRSVSDNAILHRVRKTLALTALEEVETI